MLQNKFSLHRSGLQNEAFFIHKTTPYIHPKLDSRIGFSNWGTSLTLCVSDDRKSKMATQS